MYLKSVELFLESRPADRYGSFVLCSFYAHPAEPAECYRGWSGWPAQTTSQAVREMTRIGLQAFATWHSRALRSNSSVHFTALTSDSLLFITFSYLCSTSWGQEGAHVLRVRLTSFQAEIAPIRNFGSHVPLTEEELVPPVSIQHPTYVSFSYMYIKYICMYV
jgi:hypothetical protein